MSEPRVIYLSGPMKGYPESNYPAFRAAADVLRRAGHRVYNPAEFPHRGDHTTFPLRQAFASYCSFICLEADTLVLLPGWEKSKGVSAEKALAENCGLEVIEFAALTTSGEPTAAQLARMHPEVLDAHAQFGGDLEDMLRRYHKHEDRT